MAANKDEGIADEVVDQLLAGRDPATVFESGGLIDELKKRLAERMLNAEMDHHLGCPVEEDTGNHRNGYGRQDRNYRHRQAGAGDSAGPARAVRPGIDRRVS